jgi:hypothetical protein
MDGVELVVKVELRPTSRTSAREGTAPERVEEGCFRMVFEVDPILWTAKGVE